LRREAGNIAWVWRSLDFDRHADVEPADRGHHDTISEENYRDGRSGEVMWWVVIEDQSPP
jgi:hypothetical protein